MSRDDDFRVRPGRIRSSRVQRAKPFIAQVLAAARKAGGRVSRSSKITAGRGPHFAPAGRRAFTPPDHQPDDYLTQKVGRLRHLEGLGLAVAIGFGQWVIAEEAEATLRELGQHDDIIRRLHRALSDQGIERGATLSASHQHVLLHAQATRRDR